MCIAMIILHQELGSQKRKKRRLIQSEDLGSESVWVSIRDSLDVLSRVGCVRFMGRGGPANSTFSHVGGLPDLFMEHDVGAL